MNKEHFISNLKLTKQPNHCGTQHGSNGSLRCVLSTAPLDTRLIIDSSIMTLPFSGQDHTELIGTVKRKIPAFALNNQSLHTSRESLHPQLFNFRVRVLRPQPSSRAASCLSPAYVAARWSVTSAPAQAALGKQILMTGTQRPVCPLR